MNSARSTPTPTPKNLTNIVMPAHISEKGGNSAGLPHIQMKSGEIPWGFRTYRRKVGRFRGACSEKNWDRKTAELFKKALAVGVGVDSALLTACAIVFCGDDALAPEKEA